MCQTMINNVSKNKIVLFVVLVTGLCAVMAIVNMLIKARILIDKYFYPGYQKSIVGTTWNVKIRVFCQLKSLLEFSFHIWNKLFASPLLILSFIYLFGCKKIWQQKYF